MKQTFYITTTLPYVNADPHIGFALEIIASDIIARYQTKLGKEVIFNTGTDEHGQKIYQKAKENNQDPQEYVDHYASKFAQLKTLLNLSYTHFTRTTDQKHIKAVIEFWNRCLANGDIYKKEYKTKYCVGCEMEKQASELQNNKCPLHPTKELEIREEENYFFRFSKYQDDLLNLYEANKEFVKPASKLKEIQAFVKQGLQDFSISRLKAKMSWGIPVPNDSEHVIYVWFDALVNYISALGWPDDKKTYDSFWPVVQTAGKDNLRQQSAMWQAMLLSAGLTNSQQILINGFISINGQKMSKSLGNVVTPTEMVTKYGTDGTRYLLMKLGPFNEDMDVSIDKFTTTYVADLSNGLGNLCSRVAKMCEKNNGEFNSNELKFSEQYQRLMNHFELKETLETQVISLINQADQFLSKEKPWTKTGSQQQQVLQQAVNQVLQIAYNLQPFMPDTARKILTHFNQHKITAFKPLFPRIEKDHKQS